MDWWDRKKGFSPPNPQLSLEENRENKRGWGHRRRSSLRRPEILGESSYSLREEGLYTLKGHSGAPDEQR